MRSSGMSVDRASRHRVSRVPDGNSGAFDNVCCCVLCGEYKCLIILGKAYV